MPKVGERRVHFCECTHRYTQAFHREGCHSTETNPHRLSPYYDGPLSIMPRWPLPGDGSASLMHVFAGGIGKGVTGINQHGRVCDEEWIRIARNNGLEQFPGHEPTDNRHDKDFALETR
jgi:hypothetical protein